jgi:hypothetical protein
MLVGGVGTLAFINRVSDVVEHGAWMWACLRVRPEAYEPQPQQGLSGEPEKPLCRLPAVRAGLGRPAPRRATGCRQRRAGVQSEPRRVAALPGSLQPARRPVSATPTTTAVVRPRRWAAGTPWRTCPMRRARRCSTILRPISSKSAHEPLCQERAEPAEAGPPFCGRNNILYLDGRVQAVAP